MPLYVWGKEGKMLTFLEFKCLVAAPVVQSACLGGGSVEETGSEDYSHPWSTGHCNCTRSVKSWTHFAYHIMAYLIYEELWVSKLFKAGPELAQWVLILIEAPESHGKSRVNDNAIPHHAELSRVYFLNPSQESLLKCILLLQTSQYPHCDFILNYNPNTFVYYVSCIINSKKTQVLCKL